MNIYAAEVESQKGLSLAQKEPMMDTLRLAEESSFGYGGHSAELQIKAGGHLKYSLVVGGVVALSVALTMVAITHKFGILAFLLVSLAVSGLVFAGGLRQYYNIDLRARRLEFVRAWGGHVSMDAIPFSQIAAIGLDGIPDERSDWIYPLCFVTKSGQKLVLPRNTWHQNAVTQARLLSKLTGLPFTQGDEKNYLLVSEGDIRYSSRPYDAKNLLILVLFAGALAIAVAKLSGF